MRFYTTTTLQGDYCGFVSAARMFNITQSQSLMQGVMNIVRRRSNAFTDQLEQIKLDVLQQLDVQATELQANAVIALQLNYQVLGHDRRFILVDAIGTAVRLSDDLTTEPTMITAESANRNKPET